MTITQADRDAAARLNGYASWQVWEISPHHSDEWMTLCANDFAAHREAAEARAREEGAKAMQEAFDIADAAPELNMSNYDHDQVDALNKAMNELHSVLKAALDPTQIAAQEPKP